MEKARIKLFLGGNFRYSTSVSGVIHKKVSPAISVSLVDPVCFVSLVRLETNFALPGNSIRSFK